MGQVDARQWRLLSMLCHIVPIGLWRYYKTNNLRYTEISKEKCLIIND